MHDRTIGQNLDHVTATGNGAAGKLGDAVHDIGAKGAEVFGAAKDVAHDAKDKIIHVADKFVDGGGATFTKLRRLAADNPVKATVIALAVGYLGMRAIRMLRA